MKKSWLYSIIAGFTLLATACTNNAAPDYTNGNNNGTTRMQSLAGNQRGYVNRGTDSYGNRAFVTNYTGTTSGAPGVTGYSAGTTGTHFGWNTGGINPIYDTGAGTNNTALGNGRRDGYLGMTGNAGFWGMRDFNVFDDGNGNRNNTYYGPLSVYRNRGMGTLGANNVSNIGYAHISSSNLRSNAVNQVYVDRDALARAIGNVTASIPGVKTATVLVTDEEVFVGLLSRGTDRQAAKNKARMSAMSVTPRYYKVYVTDNQQMISEMSRIASRTSNVNANITQDERSIDSLIRSFGGQADGDERRSGGGTSPYMTGTKGSRPNTKAGTTTR